MAVLSLLFFIIIIFKECTQKDPYKTTQNRNWNMKHYWNTST